MNRMATTLHITIDCADPARLVRFWAEALGYAVEPPPDGYDTWVAYWRSLRVPEEELPDEEDVHDSIVDPSGAGPRIWFQLVPEPKTVKNRVHLDLQVGGGRDVPIDVRRPRVDAEVDRLVGLGASRLRVNAIEGSAYYAVVMQDPEGNEFCLT
jgi:catechol 2,3-dioxygenase-like lactoylglutathione lyase family enzyme